ncbi:MAG TPA: CRISPR-associated helicase Cas3' [Clostridia bacterium]|nr:CRISPR-associated helicase Cas3' [Clostridia bacterium]
MPFYSHRDERRFYLLSVHLAHVAAGAVERLAAMPDARQLASAASIAGIAHDFGKYTGFFQRYLRTGRGGPEKQHAFISSLWAAYLASWLDLGSTERLSLFLTVMRHHQGLADPEEYLLAPRKLVGTAWDDLEPTDAGRLHLLETQLDDIRKNARVIARSINTAMRYAARLLARKGVSAPEWLTRDLTVMIEALTEFLDGWVKVYGELYTDLRRLKRQPEKDLAAYFRVLSLFSALIDADKIHAARVDEVKRPDVPCDAVSRYRALNFDSPRGAMDSLRNDLYETVISRVNQAGIERRLFTITAPTGTGKTLAGLGAALSLRARLTGSGRPTPRIIYALPFTSIIDQTFAVAEAVLHSALPGLEEIPSSWLLKHHHLAEPVYWDADGEDGQHSLEASLLLIESWQSEIVITTFVQLFHTLVGYENRMLKKFHRLGGAILILDEVQSVPVEYWPLVIDTLRQAVDALDLRVILMTATRPEWFGSNESLELAGNPESVRGRFEALDRVMVAADMTPLTVEQAAAEFLGRYQKGRAYLVVLNTIKSSITFYQILRQASGDQRLPLYYLSTNIVPAERERRLREIRERLKRHESPVVVSTQVVEAGVDLDFDEVWRDLGPVDAVVQVAGRCNRNFRQKRGTVRVMHFVEDKDTDQRQRSLASYVYGGIHTVAARRLFADKPSLAEPDFFDVVADYFRLVREGKSAAISEDLLCAMARLRFSRRPDEEARAVSDFALIRELPYYVDVFVCTDAKAEEVWERYQAEVASQRDLRCRAAAFLALKRDFRRYLLSVPSKLVLHRLSDEIRPLCVPHYLLNEFYDAETGFKRVTEESALVW